MSIRDLDPDRDYAYDKTNQSPARFTSSLVQECEARARRCAGFHQHPDPRLYGVCVRCNGPKYAHPKVVA
jgi:hypothetical protein